MGKLWQLISGAPGSGGPSHVTTGTMINPALPKWTYLKIVFLDVIYNIHIISGAAIAGG